MDKNITWIVIFVVAVIALAIIAGLLHFIFSNMGYILLIALLVGGGYMYYKKNKSQ
jgi:hypothetical protein